MKGLVRKILSFMLAALMIVGIMPVEAAAFDYSGWLWPVPSSNRMSRGYYSGHEAIDIVPYEKNYSETEIYASKAGTVKVVYTGCKNFSNYEKQTCKSAGNCNPSDGYNSEGYCNNGFGNGVVIDHGNGITSEYAHMTDRFFVKEGQQIQKGQLLGYMGSYGMSTGPHLHFSIKENGVGIINNPIGDNYICSGRWNGIDTILYETYGYGGAEEPVVIVSWEQDVEDDHWAIWWTDGVIGAKATVSGVSTTEIYQVGVKLYDSNLNLLAQKLESGDYSGKYNYVRMWYYINEELGYVLTPNTDYKCQFQIAVNETVYYSPYYDFRTQGPTQYTVTYDANGGWNAPASQTITQGENFTISGQYPIREGYEFMGWATSPTSTVVEYWPNGVHYAEKDLYLYAVWKANTYTVTYDANGGSGAPATQKKTHGIDITLSETIPVRTGYKFLGWAGYQTATEPEYYPGGKYTYNSDVTMYAIWQANTYTVTYDANGGSNAPETQTKTEGEALKLSDKKPVRDGYEFLGWATSKTAITAQYQPGDSYTKDESVTLYAVWKQKEQQNTADIVIKDVSGRPGEEITVTVSIENNPGISVLNLPIKYDKNILEKVSFEGQGLDGSWQYGTNATWVGENSSYNGAILIMKFKIKDTAEEGTTTISISSAEAFDENENEVSLNITNGSVKIVNSIPGDVTGDGKVNSLDLLRLHKFIAGIDVEVDLSAADVTGDGKVNSLDLLRLHKFIAGMDVELK